MMADGYNARRSGERFQNSPSKYKILQQLIHAAWSLFLVLQRDGLKVIPEHVDILYYAGCGNTVAQNNRDAYCAQIHKIS